jgi:hypothetical protein
MFSEYKNKTLGSVLLPDKTEMAIAGTGIIDISTELGEVKLKDVLHVPGLRKNLFSVSQAMSTRHDVKFEICGSTCYLRNIKSGKAILKGKLKDGLYILEAKSKEHKRGLSKKAQLLNSEVVSDWHSRLGHANPQTVTALIREGRIQYPVMTNGQDTNEVCPSCAKGKMTRKPFKKGRTRTSTILGVVHSDLCGPMEVESLGKSRYFLSCIDESSNMCWIMLLRKKSDAALEWQKWYYRICNEMDTKVKELQHDSGGEFVSKEFKEFLCKEGIRIRETHTASPQENSIAERMNRTLMNMSRSMLIHANLPKSFWGESVKTACYLKNLLPTRALDGKIPFEVFYNKPPSYDNIRCFGCLVYTRVPDEMRKKLDQKSKECLMMGYSETTKGYRVYDIESRKIILSRDVIFNEREFPGLSLKRKTQEKTTDTEGEVPEPIPERPKRVRRSVGMYEEIDPEILMVKESVLLNSALDEPKSFQEAINGPYSEEWKAAIQRELESLVDNDTWKVVERMPEDNVVKCKWVFRVKQNPDGTVDRFKARLVAKGYSQKHGIDYFDTFAPVIKMVSIRVILCIALSKGLKIKQKDVDVAFLNSEVKERLIMEVPEGLDMPSGKVLEMKKCLYGFKQSPLEWNENLNCTLEEIGLKRCLNEPCLYIRNDEKGYVIVGVYVDDIVIAYGKDEAYVEISKYLESKYKMKDLGDLKWCLGIEVSRHKDTIVMSQRLYIKRLLEKFRLENCKPIDTPRQRGTVLSENMCPKTANERFEMAKVPYRSAVGALMYLMVCTRPDIAQAVGEVSRFLENPGKEHWNAVKRILRYVHGTQNCGLVLTGNGKLQVSGYADADYAGCIDSRRSTSGCAILLGDNCISWRSKRQPSVALSTCEAEYMALCESVKEVIWLRMLLDELGLPQVNPSKILEDNQGCIKLAENPVVHGRSKHIDVRYHFIRERVRKVRDVVLEYCSTNDMVADILTKPLDREKFAKFREKIGVKSLLNDEL